MAFSTIDPSITVLFLGHVTPDLSKICRKIEDRDDHVVDEYVHLPIIGHIQLEGYVYKMSARKRRKARFETLAYSGEIMPTKFAMNPSPRPNRDLQLASQPHTGRSCQICPKIHGFFFGIDTVQSNL